MSKDIGVIISAQQDLFGRIARSYENLKKSGAAKFTRGLVEARMQTLDANWARFEAQHEKLRATCWDELASQDYRKKDLFSLTEEAFLQQKGMFLDALHSLETAAAAPTQAGPSAGGQAPRTTLPRIQLPQFAGKYEEWPAFRDLFNSIIGSDPSINQVEKLHYLKSCLKGEAELLVQNLPTTEANFGRAWQTLVAFFENKRLLVRSYLNRFTALQKMKAESAEELRRLYHGVVATVGALDGIGRPLSRNEDLFVHLVVELLDPRSRREWESSLSETTEPASFGELQQFLDRRLHVLEALLPAKQEAGPPSTSSGASARPTRSLHAKPQASKRDRCSVCHGDHFVMLCDEYRRKTAVDRRRHVEDNGLCFNCLGRHRVSECSSKRTCSLCDARHHTTLHEACDRGEVAKTAHFTQRSASQPVRVLLATARVLVRDRFGHLHTVRALIDQGSEASLVAEALVQRLKLTRSSAAVEVVGVGGKRTGRSRGLASLEMSPWRGGAPTPVSALILPRITLYEGRPRVDHRAWTHIRGLELADPDFWGADPAELLLGAEVFASILRPGLRRGRTAEPVAQRTALGWILSGTVGGADGKNRDERPAVSLHCSVDQELTTLVKEFWLQEELPAGTPPLTGAELACEEHFRLTHVRLADGRYEVRLPVVEPLPDLRWTRRAASRGLDHLERRFGRDARLRGLYEEFMRQYADLGHMVAVRAAGVDDKRVSYLPHHGVMREASATTKLRVVFNGSTALSSGESLNRALMVGPNLLPALGDVLLRWRRHQYVVAADVEKMYRQIRIHKDDQDLQRILWRTGPGEGVQEYRLTTVTYGLSCAPFLAMRTLRQLADDEEQRWPGGANSLRRDVYMDDVLTGADSAEEARRLRLQLTEICEAGGFPLRKWSANSEALLVGLPAEHRVRSEPRTWQPAEHHSTLGLLWHPGVDCFSFAVRGGPLETVTKRSVLSLTARLFDPLGWLAPAVVKAKIAFQATWLQGLGWDDPLDDLAAQRWRQFALELPLLERVRVPRRIYPAGKRPTRELHGFSDASEKAYAAAVYMRVADGDGAWQTVLVAAKTRVAPLRSVSLPRLELCAAVLSARLAAHVRDTLDVPEVPLHLWSDSTVALGWLRDHPARWKTYVANRVAEIQRTVPEARWHHIPGRDNPADCASRGVSPGELLDHPLWWQGPPWLREEAASWPAPTTWVGELPEARARVLLAAVRSEPDRVEPNELMRFSSLSRLLRVTAWCRRWLSARRSADAGTWSSPRGFVLTAWELEEACWSWVRLLQGFHLGGELAAVRQRRPLSRANPLVRLSPFVDPRGLLRVGGRLGHSLLAYDERHPVILPPDSHFTRLVVESCHRRTLHGGVQLTLGVLRQRYWVPRGRAVVKRVILRCVTCARWRAATPSPLMASLPRERVRPARPFLHVGVDYAGPIQLRTTRGRGHRSYKGFIAVFVCLATRAVHLEAVSDYTADAFLAALRRFVSRRGLCSSILSDCGTNFVGADAQLRRLFSASSAEGQLIANQLASDQIQWRFNPPSAPHFGGIWEAAVKSLKLHVRRVIGETTLTYEEMSTLLAQVEACLNSRPLQPLSDDPEDLAALTPGHFLVGSALTAVPEPSMVEVRVSSLTRWQLLQRLRDHFWDRWSREYLHSLQHRPKWCRQDSSLQVGQLVLVRNENTPPARWPLARVIRVHPGKDDQVRVVTVRTASGELTRPVVKLVLLPCRDEENPTEG